jgi:hypothetical protein
VNRWATRYASALQRELEEGEVLRTASRVVVTAASTVAPSEPLDTADRNERWLRSRSDRIRQSAARGRGARHARLAVARELGFPLPGAAFVLGLSDQRVLFWRASAGAGSPKELAGALPVGEVAAMRFARKLRATRLGVLLEAGPLLVVQPLWSRNLDELADAFAAVRGGNH